MVSPAFSTKALFIAKRIAVSLVCVSLIAGQLIRLTLPGQGGGILLSDIAVLLFLAVSFISSFLPSPVLGEGGGEG